MADTRGTWSLSEAWGEKTADEWVPISNVWVDELTPSPNFAYVGGGRNPNYDKMDLSSDTRLYGQYSWEWSPSSSGRAQFYCASTGGGSHGYWSGGGGSLPSPNWSSAVDKRTFAPGTSDAVALTNPSSNLTIGRACHKGISAPSHGYFVGGAKGSPTSDLLSAVDKITNATDTVSRAPGADLPSVNHRKHMLATTGNSSVGYILGGVSPISSASAKIAFATDSTSQSPGSNAIIARSYSNGSSSGTACYWFGGVTIPGVSYPYSTSNSTSNFEKTTIATDTNSSVGNNPAGQGAQQMAVTGNETATYTFGYGGPTSGGGNASYKMPYSNETMSPSPGTNLYSAKSGASAFCPRNGGITAFPAGSKERWFDNASEPPNTAYGNHGSWQGSIYKFDFAASTLSYPFGTISHNAVSNNGSQRYRAASISSSSAGYISGGNTYVTPSSAVNTQNKITYATDVNANLPGSTIGDARWGHAGIADATAGWYWGGNTGSGSYNRTHIYKTTFATDAVTTSPAQMTAGSYMIHSTNSASAGYTFGGHSYPTSCQKLTFATESCTLLPAVMPSVISVSGSSTGTQTAGYVTSGTPSNSTVAKITWATETSANIPSTLSAARSQTYAVGNTTVGFFGGGSPGGNSRIDSIPYATETISVVPSWSPSPMYSNSYYGTGTGARNKGIPVNLQPTATPTPSKAPGPSFDGALWMGGYNAEPAGGVVSSGGKIEFSTDTVTELPSTHLTGNRYNLAATAAVDTGYYGNAQTTQVVKVTYGTATPSVLPGGLSGGNSGPAAPYDPRRRGAAFGPKTEGYMMQGGTGYSGSLNNFDRIVYATEVISRLPGSNCPDATYATSGTSNQTTGYLNSGAAGSTMRKIPFATLSWTNAPGANFTMWDGRTFANSTHGFWVGSTGNANGSQLQKLTFASDTASRIPGSNFPFSIRYGWGSGNSTYGWCSGGGGSSVDTKSNFYKLNYSNDTWSTASATTSQRRWNSAAAGARQSGMEVEQVPGASPVLI